MSYMNYVVSTPIAHTDCNEMDSHVYFLVDHLPNVVMYFPKETI